MKLFLLGLLLIYGVERVFETFWKRNRIEGHVIAPYTLYLLVMAHFSVFLVALYEGATKDAMPTFSSYIIIVVGCLCVAIATRVRISSIQTLGVYHSVQIEIRKNHELIMRGPYHFVRNPYYLSNAIEVIGFPLIVNSLIGATLGLLLYWPCLYLRMVLEERALLEAMRVPFSEYMSRVPRVVPTFFHVGARI
jgi:protein-S-isoprenylcysteine O-methyltransferase Ste14